jgi:Leucine-rich repeat (LRR) protein
MGMAEFTEFAEKTFQGNQLHYLPESISSLKPALWLFENQIQRLPESLIKLSRLLLLDVSRNQPQVLPESMEMLTELWTLNVSITIN